jgi:RNA polymerase sigma-70 factor (subfamily 1)
MATGLSGPLEEARRTGNPRGRALVRRTLWAWQNSSGLASVRDKQALAKLPAPRPESRVKCPKDLPRRAETWVHCRLTLGEDTVPYSTATCNQLLGEFRAYLETLTFIHIDPRLRSKFSVSDIIQNTLVEAWRELERIETMDADRRKARLREMLIHNLLDKIDEFRTGKRDVRLEQSLDEAAVESSCRLRDWLAAEQSTPSGHLIEHEKKLRVLEALSQLPEREREALILQQYHGWKLREIAEHLECTTNAVAGYQARGRKRLRELLADLE